MKTIDKIQSKLPMRSLTLCLLSTFTFVSLSESALDLYLEPSLTDSPIATVETSDASLSEGSPVLDEEKAAVGWQWAEYSNTMEGYIPDAKIGKDLFPVNGALIRLLPDENARVLTSVQAGDDIEIVDTGAWWKVRFTKAIPVYYLEETPALAPAVVVAPSIVAADTESAVEVAPQGETTLLDLYESSLDQKAKAAEQPSTAVGLRQQFEGVLIRTKPKLGLFEPKDSFALLDAQGRRIGWVDLSELVIPGSFDTYIGKEIIIHGSKSFDSKGKNLTIHAQNMRIK